MPQPKPVMAAGPEQVIIAFRFQSNDATDPDFLVSGSGAVTDITEAAGVYTCTLAPEYRYLTLVTCHTSCENDVTIDSQFTSYTASTGALVVTTLLKATEAVAQATQPPATTDKWIHVTAILCRRSELAPSVAI